MRFFIIFYLNIYVSISTDVNILYFYQCVVDFSFEMHLNLIGQNSLHMEWKKRCFIIEKQKIVTSLLMQERLTKKAAPLYLYMHTAANMNCVHRCKRPTPIQSFFFWWPIAQLLDLFPLYTFLLYVVTLNNWVLMQMYINISNFLTMVTIVKQLWCWFFKILWILFWVIFLLEN